MYIADSTQLTYSDTGLTGNAPPDPQILADLALAVQRSTRWRDRCPIDAPWEAPNAAANGTRRRCRRWLEQNTLTRASASSLATATRPIFGAEPSELSLLFVLFYIAASGNETTPGTFERNFNTRGGAQMSRVVGGSQTIALTIAAQLGGTCTDPRPGRAGLAGAADRAEPARARRSRATG